MGQPWSEAVDGQGGVSRAQVRLGLIWLVVTLVVDQAHKLWSIFGLQMKRTDRFVLTPFLDVVYVINQGISYGMFQMGTWQGQWLLAGFAAAVAIFLVGWLMRVQHSPIAAASIGMIAGGALGNAIDRLHLGGVADFFSLHAFGFYWYVFNIADVAIVAGVVGLLYDSWRASRKGAVNHD